MPYSLTVILILAVTPAGCGGSSGGGGGTTRYTLNITIENGPGCTVTPASGTSYPAGTVVELTATGATGYALDHWGGTDGASVAGNKITMDGNKNIVAVFAKLKYDLTVNVTPEGAGTVDTVITLQAKSVYGVEHGRTVQLTAKVNSSYLFDRWEGALSGSANPITLTVDGVKTVTAVFIPWQTIYIPVLSVPGAAGFPTGTDDSGGVCITVNHRYLMADTEVTYEQWYAVKTWAVAHGYTFTNNNNAGREGSMGTDGAAPTTAYKRHPVTMVTWRDAIVWCNALTEYYNKQNGTNLECAYKYNGAVVKNATDATAYDSVSDGVTTTGFRLPTSMEWELAARYRGSDNTNAVEYPTGGGIYWTKGNSAGGAIGVYTNTTATGEVAWWDANSGDSYASGGGQNPQRFGYS